MLRLWCLCYCIHQLEQSDAFHFVPLVCSQRLNRDKCSQVRELTVFVTSKTEARTCSCNSSTGSVLSVELRVIVSSKMSVSTWVILYFHEKSLRSCELQTTSAMSSKSNASIDEQRGWFKNATCYISFCAYITDERSYPWLTRKQFHL
jgi:hypothetical protein